MLLMPLLLLLVMFSGTLFLGQATTTRYYMDKPQGQIRINCDEQADWWQFSITDNGPGIEKEHFETIFQMFQTLAPKDKSDSTGIGLALVKRIVKTYGGKVWVESEFGRGSTFFFTIPKNNIRIRNAELQSSTVS